MELPARLARLGEQRTPHQPQENGQMGSSETGTSPADGGVAEMFHPDRAPSYAEFHRVLGRARSEEPVFFWPELNAWVITRYEDVYRVLMDSEFFSETGSHEGPNRFP